MKNRAMTSAERFHGRQDTELTRMVGGVDIASARLDKHIIIQEREVAYRFYLHQHPFVRKLTRRLLTEGTAGLQAADTEYVTNPDGSVTPLPDGGGFEPTPEWHEAFFEDRYAPDDETVDPSSHPSRELDFSQAGAYAVYNWELFFHVPLTIAIHLSKNQRFAEAQRWFHFIFDPTDDSDGPTPDRFWKARPFHGTDVRKMEEILVNLVTGRDPALRDWTIRNLEAWRDAPFRPHQVARYRPQAYMYKTVMAYLENLIAWGDSLFRQDTGEAIDEAMMLYVLAADILGPRPQVVPKKGSVRPQTYQRLRHDIARFGTVLRDMEADLPFDVMPLPRRDGGGDERLASLGSLGKTLYFCVPRNDKLLGFWDTVADRLFKIRNSLNLQGVFRRLALFEPPIDPAVLARASAAGVDVGAVVSGLNQPLPLVRFRLLVQKAGEIVQEVKSLGHNLLSAMEKGDNEALALLRAKHEKIVMGLVEQVRYGQLQEATKSKECLSESLAQAVQRYVFYERQLGKSVEEAMAAVPERPELDKARLEKMAFEMDEGRVMPRDIDINIDGTFDKGDGKIMSHHEAEEMEKLGVAQAFQTAASTLDALGGVLAIIPQFQGNAEPMGMGASVDFGGQHLHSLASSLASVSRAVSGEISFRAARAGKLGAFERREQEWAYQSNVAAGEINRITRQIRAAELREAVAELELSRHRQQMENAEEMDRFLNEAGTERDGKKTNKALYAWMKREVKGLYAQCYQFAYDVAKKAERALQHELGNSDLRYIQPGYLSGKEGLLAGEKLQMDLKRMEMAYLDLDRREYELTKHVSLLQLNPMELVQLRATGLCEVSLPETLFDMDGPGHYFRRIKSVAVSIPCVTGPYTGVNCTLTLRGSTVRKSPALRGDPGYARERAVEDDRFEDYFGTLQSIVTSAGENDSGLFETNLRDERYLPFENAGVISDWQLQLPMNPTRNEPALFDYETISDVILHIRYTAREGGRLLRAKAVENLTARIAGVETTGCVRLFSVRHEFPSEWSRFRAETGVERSTLALTFRPEHYPFWSQGRLGSVKKLEIMAKSEAPSITVCDTPDDSGNVDTLMPGHIEGLLVKALENISPPAAPTGTLALYFDNNEMSDLWIALTWGA